MIDLELLIGAAREERVSAEVQARVLRGVEARHGVLLATAFAGDSSGMRSALAYLNRARGTPAALGSTLGSTFNIALVVAFAGLISSGALVANPAEPSPETSPELATEPPPQVARESIGVAEIIAKTTEEAPVKRPAAKKRAVEKIEKVEVATPPIEAPDTSAWEVHAVEEATRAIKSGDAAHALNVLDRFDATPAKPTLLEEERTALRVRALCALERRDEARTHADRFAAAHPSSPLLRRLEACLKGGDNP